MEEKTEQLFRATVSGARTEPGDPDGTCGAVVLAFERARASANPEVG